MQQALAARGIPDVQVVQPNRYFGDKSMSAEEASIAINLESQYRQRHSRLSQLLAAVPVLQREGVNIVDATGLFDGLSDTIYSDDCCHYNQRGNDLLAALVAEAILAKGAVGPSSKARLPE